MDLVITSPGAQLGKSSACFVVRLQGRIAAEVPATSVECIHIGVNGVSVSGDALAMAAENDVAVLHKTRLP